MEILLKAVNYLCQRFLKIDKINVEDDKITIKVDSYQLEYIRSNIKSPEAKIWSYFKIKDGSITDILFYNQNYMSDTRLTFEAPLSELIYAVGDYLGLNSEQILKVRDFLNILN